MKKQKRVRIGMRWMNLCGGEGGEERRWGFGGSSAMIVSPPLITPPWRWSLEEGEPNDCLCIVAKLEDREDESETQKMPECRERERKKREIDTKESASVNFIILWFFFIFNNFLFILFWFLFFCDIIFLGSWPHCCYSLVNCLSFFVISFLLLLRPSLHFFFFLLFTFFFFLS